MGQTRLLKNKENQRIRLLMRQEKTLKIRANHLGALRAVRTCCEDCVRCTATVGPVRGKGQSELRLMGYRRAHITEEQASTCCKRSGVGGAQ